MNLDFLLYEPVSDSLMETIISNAPAPFRLTAQQVLALVRQTDHTVKGSGTGSYLVDCCTYKVPLNSKRTYFVKWEVCVDTDRVVYTPRFMEEPQVFWRELVPFMGKKIVVSLKKETVKMPWLICPWMRYTDEEGNGYGMQTVRCYRDEAQKLIEEHSAKIEDINVDEL